ncbi:cytochrome P450 [Nocardia sp. NPDC052254]|uniref:cytochrome P450 n=1 Tax=Nocardia sp. NPDC052254 TaxID=3155681 RepID=UPI003420869E
MAHASMSPEKSAAEPAPPIAPGRLPVVGHLPALLRDPLEFLESLLPLGDIVTIYLGGRPMYFLNSLDLVHTVLVERVEEFRRGIIFEKAEKVLGNGLTVLEGEPHRKQRKLIRPALHMRQIENYTDTMIAIADERTRTWRTGQPHDMNLLMHDLAMEIFCRALFRNELADDAAAQVKVATPSFMAGIVAQSLYPAPWMEQIPLPVNLRIKRARHQMSSAVVEIVGRYRAMVDAADPGDIDTRASILDVLVAGREQETGAAMSDEQLQDEIINLVVAGAEAPGTTLAWLFHELSCHPDVEQRLREEIDTELGAEPLTFENLQRLTYASAVITETLRLHTPTWMLTRRPLHDIELAGYHIPAGGEVAFGLTTLHRHEQQYGNPGEFDPSRWLDGSAKDLPRSCFMPFGMGKHRCLGEHFTQNTMLVAIATIMRRWRLVPAPGTTVREQCVALVQAKGLTMVPTPVSALSE